MNRKFKAFNFEIRFKKVHSYFDEYFSSLEKSNNNQDQVIEQ